MSPPAPRAAGGAAAAGWAAGLALAALLAIRIDAPWTYIHDDNGAWTHAVAAAHLEAGLERTRGQDFMLRRADGALVPYLHHPPLFPLAVAAAYRLSGESSPLVTRLVPALFHLLGFAGFCLLARTLFPGSAARRASAAWIYALVPMGSFFGKMPFNESMGLAAIVWALALACAYRERPRAALLAGSGLCWLIACATSWPAFLLLAATVALFLEEAWATAQSDGRRSGSGPGAPRVLASRVARRAAGALALVAALASALVIGHLAWAAGGSLERLLGAGGIWSAAGRDPLTFLRQVGVAIDNDRRYFANVPFVLYAGWCVARLRCWLRGERPGWATRLILAGSAASLLWALVFVRQVALHAYGQFWFLPFVSLGAAYAAVSLWERWRERPRLRAAFAAVAVLGTVISTAVVLHYRYTHVHAYAVETAAMLRNEYKTWPARP